MQRESFCHRNFFILLLVAGIMVNEKNRAAYQLESFSETQKQTPTNCQTLKNVYGDNYMFRTIIFMWHKRFSKTVNSSRRIV